MEASILRDSHSFSSSSFVSLPPSPLLLLLLAVQKWRLLRTPTTPPPVIGKIGPYTVFLTPPPTPTPTPSPSPSPSTKPPAERPFHDTAKKPVLQSSPQFHTPSPPPLQPKPPVQPPPAQFNKPSDDRFGFLRDAISKVQNAHSSLDEYVANWLGLNQSKYQWALDDYYETKGVEKLDAKTKEISSKSQCV
ncbi:hypothetical protein Ancab_017753 [Ancistrocladus abbreviatus]